MCCSCRPGTLARGRYHRGPNRVCGKDMLINSELTQISWRRGDSGSVTAEELVRSRAATLMRFGTHSPPVSRARVAPC